MDVPQLNVLNEYKIGLLFVQTDKKVNVLNTATREIRPMTWMKSRNIMGKTFS